MALVSCNECGNQVSSTAKNCPQCGARVKPKSKLWLWVLGVPIGVFVVFAIIGANDPQAEAKSHDRRAFEVCMSDLNDPLKDPVAKNTIIRPVCERLRSEFRSKYGVEP